MNIVLGSLLSIITVFYTILFVVFAILLIIALLKNMHTIHWVKGPEVIDINDNRILFMRFKDTCIPYEYLKSNNIRVSYVYNTSTGEVYVPTYNGLAIIKRYNYE